jgi:hypothetical protein
MDVHGEESGTDGLSQGEKPESDNLRARIRPGRGKLPEVLCTMVPKGKSAEKRDWGSGSGERWGRRRIVVAEIES